MEKISEEQSRMSGLGSDTAYVSNCSSAHKDLPFQGRHQSLNHAPEDRGAFPATRQKIESADKILLFNNTPSKPSDNSVLKSSFCPLESTPGQNSVSSEKRVATESGKSVPFM